MNNKIIIITLNGIFIHKALKKYTSQINLEDKCKNENKMSKKLQEKADRIIKELQDAIIPLREEIKNLKNSSGRI